MSLRSRSFWAAAVAAAILALSLPAAAAADVPESPRTVVVTGEARLSARPDTVQLSVGIDTREPTAARAQQSNARVVERVMAALQDSGVKQSDVQTGELRLTPVYRYDQETGAQHLEGYEASYTLRLTLPMTSPVGAVVDAAVAAGANRLDSIQFTVRDTQALKERGLAEAVRDASRQAAVVAEAAGVQLGPLLSVSGIGFSGPPPAIGLMATKFAPQAARDAVTPIESGLLEFTAQATLTFEIH